MKVISKHKLVLITLLSESFLLFLSFLFAIIFSIPVITNINITFYDSCIAVCAFLFLALVNYLFIFILPNFITALTPLRKAYNSISIILKDLDTTTTILISLISGIAEEIFFRGCLQPLLGIIIASIIFGLCHFADRKTLPYAIYAIFIGFYFGYLYFLTNNLWIPILVHILNNALAIPVMKFNAQNISINNDTDE